MIKCKNYWFPDSIEHKYDYFIKHMDDARRSFRYVTNRSVCVQAGGHVGLWPLYLSRYFKQVITFEPETENFKCLSENIRGNTSIKAYQEGLGSSTGYSALNISGNNTGGHFITEGEDLYINTIDSLDLKSCGGIYLDIEGQELNALLGAKKTINKFSPVLMLEVKDHISKGGCTSEELTKYLTSIGYRKVAKRSHDSIFVRKRRR